MARDAGKLFNFVTGYVDPQEPELLAISPLNMRETLYELIDREIDNVRAGRPGAIWAKLNALTEKGVIDRLYEASQAGVQIVLVVRGICCLRPGVPGLSETITVKSIIGRFLEHSRIWAFGNGDLLPSDQARLYHFQRRRDEPQPQPPRRSARADPQCDRSRPDPGTGPARQPFGYRAVAGCSMAKPAATNGSRLTARASTAMSIS